MEKIKLGTIVDGYWKIVSRKPTQTSYRCYHYTLENIYNHRTVEIEYRSLVKIIEGKQSVSYFIKRQIPKNQRTIIF